MPAMLRSVSSNQWLMLYYFICILLYHLYICSFVFYSFLPVIGLLYDKCAAFGVINDDDDDSSDLCPFFSKRFLTQPIAPERKLYSKKNKVATLNRNVCGN